MTGPTISIPPTAPEDLATALLHKPGACLDWREIGWSEVHAVAKLVARWRPRAYVPTERPRIGTRVATADGSELGTVAPTSRVSPPDEVNVMIHDSGTIRTYRLETLLVSPPPFLEVRDPESARRLERIRMALAARELHRDGLPVDEQATRALDELREQRFALEAERVELRAFLAGCGIESTPDQSTVDLVLGLCAFLLEGAHEWSCPGCGTRVRARMADQ